MTAVDSTLQPALDIYETATLFRCHPKTVQRMINDGRLAAVKVGSRWRITHSTAMAHLNGGSAA
jgi:excisionase family DNA binding protein